MSGAEPWTGSKSPGPLPPSDAERAFLHDYLQREARFEVVWSDLRTYAQGLKKI